MTTPKEKKPKPKKKPPKGNLAHGRPTKLNKETTTKFTDAIAIGAGYELASLYAGISPEVAMHWMREARRERARRESGEKQNPKYEPYLTFLKSVDEAKAEAGINYQQILDRAAKSDPQWAYKMQRVRFHMDYQEIDTNEEVEIPADMDIEFLDRIIAGESSVVVVRDWKQYQKEQQQTAPKGENETEK